VPLEIEEKKLEFQYAGFGAATIEVVYPLIKTNLGDIVSEEELVEWLAIRPRQVLNLAVPVIREGENLNRKTFKSVRKQSSYFWTFMLLII